MAKNTLKIVKTQNTPSQNPTQQILSNYAKVKKNKTTLKYTCVSCVDTDTVV